MSWRNELVDAESAFEKSFGSIKSGTIYGGYDGTLQKKYENEMVKKSYIDLQKAAISDRVAGTASKVGIPIYLDRDIIDVTAREAPLTAIIPRVANRGRTADYDRMTVKGSGSWLPEDSALTEANDTYETKSKAIKYLYQTGRVTGPLFAASKERMAELGVGDFLNLEVRNKSVKMREMEENSLINGNYSVTDGNEPLGILKEIYDNGNKTSKSGLGDLSISDLDEMIRICRTAGDSTTLGGEMPNLFITDYATENKLKGLFYDAYRINAPTQTWGWGMQSAVISGVPVLGSRFMQAATGSRNLACINTRYIETRVLQDMTYEELAKTNDSDKFMLKEYLTFVVKAPEFMNLYYSLS